MNKYTLFASLLCMSINAFAQWTKPSAPARTSIRLGNEYYLYNRDADAFLTGANEWGTRASVSKTHGHKIYFEIYLHNNGWDAESYYITNLVEQGDRKGEVCYMFMDNLDQIYVDNTKDGKENNAFTIQYQEDGSFYIGLSKYNAEYTPEKYPDTYLGIIPEMEDSRIYACSPSVYNLENGYDSTGFMINWYVVSPEDYQNHVDSIVLYDSACKLHDIIKLSNRYADIDTAIVKYADSIYNNSSSSLEELKLAYDSLNNNINYIIKTKASVDNPLELLSMIGGIEQTFTSETTQGWTMNINCANKQALNANRAKDPEVTGIHLENWHPTPFGTGKIYSKVTNIPNGVYKFSTLAFSNVLGETYIYAGNYKKAVESSYIDIDTIAEVTTIVTNGELEFGLSVEAYGPNWVGIDNVNLYYLGNDSAAYEYIGKDKLNICKDFEKLVNDSTICYYSKAEYKEFLSARDSLKKVSNYETVESFRITVENMDSSIISYKNYKDLYDEVKEWINTVPDSEVVLDTLFRYIYDAECDTLFNGNGSALYILNHGSLSHEETDIEKDYLTKIYANEMALNMTEGNDCTRLLENPDFSEQGGWTSNVGPVWPAGTDMFHVFEAKNMACDIYQSISNVRNGVYEMKLNVAFRPGSEYSKDNEKLSKAYIYINDDEQKVPCVNFKNSEEASDAFASDSCIVSFYGIVHDGTLKLGITNKVRSVEGCMLWGGNVKLYYHGKNDSILRKTAEELVYYADDLLQEDACGQTEADALRYACNNLYKGDLFEEIINIKKAITDVKEGIEIYDRFYYAICSLSETIKNCNADKEDITNAKYLYEKYKNHWIDHDYTSKQVADKIEVINKLIVDLKLAGVEEGSEENPVDYSMLIVNSNFDPEKGDINSGSIEGWETTTMNGYKENCISYNKLPFELSQKINGLKKGNYKVTVHTYYRAGYWNDEEKYIAEGKDVHNTILYATTKDETYSIPVMTLTEGASRQQLSSSRKYYTLSNGLFAPDGTTGSKEFFDEGAYLNELTFKVNEECDVTIGLSKKETIMNDYECVGKWELWYLGQDEVIPENAQDAKDFTSLIVNNNFDPERGSKIETKIDGWTTTSMNSYKKNSVSYSRSEFDINQTITGLKTGTYKASVYAYYRAGYYNDEEDAISNGTETHLANLYAKTSEVSYSHSIMNISEGSLPAEDISEDITTYTLSNGSVVPDGTDASIEFFRLGRYLNEVFFYINDGKVTIGINKKQVIANDYAIIGTWNLYYYGKGNYVNELNIATDIDNPEEAEVSPVEYYTVNGTKLSGPQKGINIIRMSDSSVIRVVIK